MESEDGDALRFGLEDTSEFILDGSLGDVWLIWVDKFNLNLFSGNGPSSFSNNVFYLLI